MASERDMDLLDDYLRNKLSAQDKSAFEEALKNDASLQKEMRVQQQVVNSLRNARVAELKRQGQSSDETAVTLRNEFQAKYPDWDQPLRVHAAATRVYAELP